METHINFLQAKGGIYVKSTGVSLWPKARKYIQPGLRARKGPFMGMSWEPHPLCCLTVSLSAWWGFCAMASASVSQSLSVGLFLFWTRRAQNDHALYTCRELYIPFILHLLGPSPAVLPNFLCCSYTCLPCSSLCSCCSTCVECLSLIFICSSGLSVNVTSLRFPVLCRVPSPSVVSYSFSQGEVAYVCSCLLVNAFLSHWNASS